MPSFFQAASCASLGFVNKKDGQFEFLFTEKSFEQIAGGKAAAIELKRELHRRKLIDTTGAGEQGTKFVVRRPLGGKKRWSGVAVHFAILDSDRDPGRSV